MSIADAEAGAQGDDDHRPPVRVGRLDDALGLLEDEEVELAGRDAEEPLRRGELLDATPLEGDDEELPQHGDVVVDRLRVVLGLELRGLVLRDQLRPDVVEPAASEERGEMNAQKALLRLDLAPPLFSTFA